jgi:hypothetical protein
MFVVFILLLFLLDGNILHKLTEVLVIYDQTPELRATIREMVIKFVARNPGVRTELVGMITQLNAEVEAALKGESSVEWLQNQPAEQEQDDSEDPMPFLFDSAKPLPEATEEGTGIELWALVQTVLSALQVNATQD